MESNFNRDFEEYLKRNADQYRMIPSEKVWKGINRSLHSRRRWYGLGLVVLLLLTTGSVTWVMLSNPITKNAELQSSKVSPFSANIPLENIDPPEATQDDMNGLLAFNNQLQKEEQGMTTTQQPYSDDLAAEVKTPALTVNFTPAAKSRSQFTSTYHIAEVVQEKKEQTITNNLDYLSLLQHPIPAQATTENEKKTIETKFEAPADPLTIESVVNSFKPKKLDRSLQWKLYFTPTVSYRKLSENKSYQNSSPFASPTNYPFAALSDVNSAVVHKPDFGFQLGVSAGYPVARNLTITGGLQFNINRYDIKAFVYNGEQATINLSGGGGSTNSVTAWTYYRNYSGYKSDWLNNFYFSVSAPIGVELKLFGKQKTYLGVAGTIQPTYILSDRAYLISTDYKNYAEVPWLIRHLNVNTSFETFVSYTNKRNTRWQIGPQVRYQVLSSFQSKYPVKENLFDFGVKLGVSLNQ